MKMNNLVGTRFKETPAECTLVSHALLVRGGYIKNVGSGIFSMLYPATRITQKIEAIIRDEMNKVGGQEVILPVTMPASLWRETGRFDSVGSELLRFKDRSGSDMVLGMTHEEAVVHLVRDAAPSYTDYPFMVYQIQTKFRDEPRARGGLMRVREFTMKDAYSFHTSQEDLEVYYEQCHKAYENIFSRVGIPEVISVQSDPGMMGGKIAHEFMLLIDAGEDTIVYCDTCDYRSNFDVAKDLLSLPGDKTSEDSEVDPFAYRHTLCPACKKGKVSVSHSTEVGNIFQLGIKYSEAMNMQYLDENGESIHPIMGCYGIGVGRLMASVCEVRNDERGPIWPMAIAPWQIHICALRSTEQPVKDAANALYNELFDKGFEVILDDRQVSAGVMFSDADLLGVPLRAIISPKTLEKGVVEISKRDKSFSQDVDAAEALSFISNMIKEMV